MFKKVLVLFVALQVASNFVFANMNKGNWVQGPTTFVAVRKDVNNNAYVILQAGSQSEQGICFAFYLDGSPQADYMFKMVTENTDSNIWFQYDPDAAKWTGPKAFGNNNLTAAEIPYVLIGVSFGKGSGYDSNPTKPL